jgi:hypothetical protein
MRERVVPPDGEERTRLGPRKDFGARFRSVGRLSRREEKERGDKDGKQPRAGPARQSSDALTTQRSCGRIGYVPDGSS